MITTLHSANGAQAKITHHGAQLISWIPARHTEQLFLSKTASFDPGSAIRGGVPVIFPQFGGLGDLPKHGFARNLVWRLREGSQTHRCVFDLRDDESTRAVWPHQFHAELIVALGDTTLEMDLAIQNCGTTPMSFTAALHTYFRVDQIDQVSVVGLKGAHFQGAVSGVETADSLMIDGHIDRIYTHSASQLDLVQKHQRVEIHKHGFPDTVVWNPWQELGAKLDDLEPDGYRHMLCVESAAVAQPVVLAAGSIWRASQRFNLDCSVEHLSASIID